VKRLGLIGEDDLEGRGVRWASAALLLDEEDR
jgi:hypothetical protein